jgi:hypothetical protein
VLNQLPHKLPAYHSSALFSRWSTWWPTICEIMFEVEQICQPDEEFTSEASDITGQLLLDKLMPVPTVSPAFLIDLE